jgi:hypothetical protein
MSADAIVTDIEPSERKRWRHRIEDLAAIRDQVKALPVGARRVLKNGPLEEPACGLCSAIAAVNGCASFAAELQDYHDVGIGTMAELADVDLGELAEAFDEMGELGERVLRTVAGALAAERSLTLYLLAGWTPPQIRRPIRG